MVLLVFNNAIYVKKCKIQCNITFLQGVFKYLREFEGGKLGIKSKLRDHSFKIIIIKGLPFMVADKIAKTVQSIIL